MAWSTGRQFDASWDRGDTFKFGLGKGQVIRGWDEGVAGMKVGGRRRITIPPDLAYGKRGAGGVIGPDETLVFVVDLVGVRLEDPAKDPGTPGCGRGHFAGSPPDSLAGTTSTCWSRAAPGSIHAHPGRAGSPSPDS